jgi:hypothetical protein
MKAMRLVAPAILVLVLPVCGFAQQAQPPAPKRVPSLTTEDVARVSPESVDEPGDAAKPAGPAKAGAGSPAASPEEAAWREQVEHARQSADAAERTAEETELHGTDLRNQLSASGLGPQERNNVIAEMDEVGKQLPDLRADAKRAKDELNRILDEGREKGFKEGGGPAATTEGGEPNDKFYKEKFAKLNDALQKAQRQVELYQDRLSDINAKIMGDGGAKRGDNFTIGGLQQERQAAQDSLDEAKAAIDKAQQDLDALKEEARQAGVPPGVFR